MSSKMVDRLSNLPEEITSQILSSMPTKFAIRTSILSKRWRYNWTLVTNLDFDDNYPVQASDSFSKFVDRVLECLKSSQLKSFRLHLNDTSFFSMSSLLNWIDKVVRLNVCELDVHAFVDKLPLSLLTCKTLTTLRLDNGGYYGNTLSGSHCQLVNLPCLKTLDISTMPSSNAFRLIKGCPILESLSLGVFLCGEEDCIFNIPTLKQLKLTVESRLTMIVNKVVLRVPNLEYLYVGGKLCSDFVMEDVSSLVEASVSFRDYKVDDLWDKLLKGISRIKSLSAQDIIRLPSRPVIFPNLKHLDLKGYGHPRLFIQVLEICPELKHLYVEKHPSTLFFKKGASDWLKPNSIPACMLTSLTNIKFSKCDGEKPDMEFLKYTLRNAKVLKMLTITWRESLHMEEQTQLAAQLLKFPRASTHCEIRFL